MNYVRPLTYQDEVLIQIIREWNSEGIRPQYSQINKRIEGRIRITEHNKKRLQQLVKENHVALTGKRYFDPHLITATTDDSKPWEQLIGTEELLEAAKENELIHFILSLRYYQPIELPTIVKWFRDEGITTKRVRQVEMTVAIIQTLMKNWKDIPEVAVPECELKGTAVIDIAWNLLGSVE